MKELRILKQTILQMW